VSQFDVYRNRNPETNEIFPFLLDVQSDLLESLRTTVVIPLGRYSVVRDRIMTKLCPIMEIDGARYAALTQQIAGIDKTLLGARVANVSHHRSAIVDAIDLIISGI